MDELVIEPSISLRQHDIFARVMHGGTDFDRQATRKK
jgi:hypothetical protein